MNRLTRKEACAFIGCGMSKLYELERSGALDGTYYQIGTRRLYITDRLRTWIENGGTKQHAQD
ncbi:MAG: hypothetical protein IJD83_02910 [Clostridia bacterium]|nr:hypothetical protein [Clostridia bacterium]